MRVRVWIQNLSLQYIKDERLSLIRSLVRVCYVFVGAFFFNVFKPQCGDVLVWRFEGLACWCLWKATPLNFDGRAGCGVHEDADDVVGDVDDDDERWPFWR